MKQATFKISGMHCNSCALNIDFDLEDLPGVKKAITNYAKSITVVDYDPSQISLTDLKTQIEKTGYTCKY